MRNDVKDRHVAAVAAAAGAPLIVTRNLKDFADLPEGIEAQVPDVFLLCLFDHAPDEMSELLTAQAAALRRPPVTLDRLLLGLASVVPSFAAAVEARLAER